ncbi:hypothetical protein ACKKBF_B40465 [Auxenochlorella protothecoides x Auxenochlorella symbiontica]
MAHQHMGPSFIPKPKRTHLEAGLGPAALYVWALQLQQHAAKGVHIASSGIARQGAHILGAGVAEGQALDVWGRPPSGSSLATPSRSPM